MASGELLIKRDGGIVIATINRPEKLNALAGHMRRDLAEAFGIARRALKKCA